MQRCPKVYIIVLNYNNAADTIECLESLREIKYANYEVILVDNASSDNSDSILSSYASEYIHYIHYIRNEYNYGYAAGNNIGIRYAMQRNDGSFVWILNNDTIVSPYALGYLVETCMYDSSIGVCGSKILYYYGDGIQGYGGRYNYWFGIDKTVKSEKEIANLDYVIGAAMFIPLDVIEKVGFFNEEYFLYYEELDFAERIKNMYKLHCDTRSIVYHKEGASTGSNSLNPINKSSMSDYFIVRNKLKFTWKYYKKFIPTVYLGIFVMLLRRIKRRQYSRGIMFFKLLIGIKNKFFESLVWRGDL